MDRGEQSEVSLYTGPNRSSNRLIRLLSATATLFGLIGISSVHVNISICAGFERLAGRKLVEANFRM